MLQLRSVYLSDPNQSTARTGNTRSVVFNASRIIGNLGAPLAPLGSSADESWNYEHGSGGDKDEEDDGEGSEDDAIIYSDDPLSVGLGLYEQRVESG